MRILRFAVFFMFLGGANCVFGAAVFVPCMSKTSNLTFIPATEVCPGVSGLPAGSTITGIKLYGFADFEDGSVHSDRIRVLFQPSNQDDWNLLDIVCVLQNQNGGTIAVTSSCGFYSGILTAPGTDFLQAKSNLAGVAAGFTVGVFREDLFGAAGTVTFGNIVEYDYTPAVPEPATFWLIGIGGAAMLYFARRRIKST